MEANPDRNPNQRPTPNLRNNVHAVGKANNLETNTEQRKPHAIAATKRVISVHFFKSVTELSSEIHVDTAFLNTLSSMEETSWLAKIQLRGQKTSSNWMPEQR